MTTYKLSFLDVIFVYFIGGAAHYHCAQAGADLVWWLAAQWPLPELPSTNHALLSHTHYFGQRFAVTGFAAPARC
jgi:hypothetical protein